MAWDPFPRAKVDKFVAAKTASCDRAIDFVGRAPFPDIFLAIHFNYPFYENIPILKRYFEPLFPNYMLCGPQMDKGGHPIAVFPHPQQEYSYYGYKCLVEAIERKPGYSGYLYVHAGMIINWWNFFKLDKTKIWFPEPNKITQKNMLTMKLARWWKNDACLKRCTDAFVEMESDPTILEMNAPKKYLENVDNNRVCSYGPSDIVYIPGRLATRYAIIAQKFYDHLVYFEASTPMSILMLEKRENIVDIKGLYKRSGEHEGKSFIEFEQRIVAASENILKDKCVDYLDR